MGRVREEVTGARRIVVKVGSSSLTGGDGDLDDLSIGRLVDEQRIRAGDKAAIQRAARDALGLMQA